MPAEKKLRAIQTESLASFTLIELLTVIAIIVILVAISLAAGVGVANKAARSRAASEMQAISTALEGYKTDNNIYPPSTSSTGLSPSTYASSDGSGGAYIASSEILFSSLTGETTFGNSPTGRVYITFLAGQVGNPTSGASYVEDPWGYAYGYYTGPGKASAVTTGSPAPYNGIGFYDLWSTGGSLAGSSTFTNTWITNWK